MNGYVWVVNFFDECSLMGGNISVYDSSEKAKEAIKEYIAEIYDETDSMSPTQFDRALMSLEENYAFCPQHFGVEEFAEAYSTKVY